MRLDPVFLFKITWEALNGPPLEEEYRFHPKRKFRADFCHLPTKTIIEIEGGTWVRGRHVRPEGYARDCEKYLMAAFEGYTVLRLTTEMVTDEYIKPIIDYILDKQQGMGV